MSDAPERTFGAEESLPPLPLPDLDSTLTKYLRSVKPFLTEQEYEHTEAVTKDFGTGAGRELHEMLQERASSMKNWLEEWWEQLVYMRPRYPIAINVNWHGVLPGTWGPSVTQAGAAAALTRSVLEFRRQLLTETLPAERMMGRPLSMHQFVRMFGSCRVPGEEMDEIVKHEGARHILVLRNNSLFAVDVLDERGEALPVAAIERSLEMVQEATASLFNLKSDDAVSVLTSEQRTTWAKVRQHLLDLDPMNKESMLAVESAIFALVLSQDSPTSHEEVAAHALHGDGRNKWFDKPFNLIVHENGRMGLNGEHAWADAIAVVSLFDFVLKDVSRHQPSPRRHGHAAAAATDVVAPEPRHLRWKLDVKVVEAIERASASFAKLIASTELKVVVFQHYGKGFIKRYNLVPDFFVQMAIQLAYYRLFREVVAVYESGHTRLFYHGRTETVRACSEESVRWVKTMTSASASDGDKFNALKAAVARHKELASDALTGQGVDRHLLGLYILNELQGRRPRPAFFTDPAYTRSTHFKLSTSNIGSAPIWGGFAAMYEDGFGVCYGIQEDKICFSVSANNNCPSTSAAAFRTALERALIDMQELCLTRNVIYAAQAKL